MKKLLSLAIICIAIIVNANNELYILNNSTSGTLYFNVDAANASCYPAISHRGTSSGGYSTLASGNSIYLPDTNPYTALAAYDLGMTVTVTTSAGNSSPPSTNPGLANSISNFTDWTVIGGKIDHITWEGNWLGYNNASVCSPDPSTWSYTYTNAALFDIGDTTYFIVADN